MKSIKYLFPIFLACISILSCAKDSPTDKEEQQKADPLSESLHIYFETAKWKREIDCSHLELPPLDLDETSYYVEAISASTNSTFKFSYPNTASALTTASNIKKYPVSDFAELKGPFHFALLLPINAESIAPGNPRIASNAGSSDTEYTEIIKIERIGTENGKAAFEIQGRYAFIGRTVGESSSGETSPVKGSFKLKVFTQDI